MVSKYKLVSGLLIAAFWILGTYLFPLQEIMPAAADAVVGIGGLLGDAVVIFLGLWTIRNRMDIALYASLIIIGIVSAIINDIPLIMFINGMRSYLIPISLLCTIRFLFANKQRVIYFVPMFEKSLYAFLLLQMPVMVIQCIRWGAYDNVGGSLGWLMSGPISTLIYVISFYLMIRRWDSEKSYLENLKSNYMLIIVLFPTMLNETKISFLYLIMYFFFLIPMDKNFFRRLVGVVPIVFLGIIGFGMVYLSLLVNNREDGEDPGNITSLQFISDYMIGDDEIRTLVLDGYMENVMPEVEENDFARGLKFATLPIIFSETPYSWVIGFGPSQFKGWSTLEPTEFAKNYEWLLLGTQMQVMMYALDLGMIGLAWMIWYLLVLFHAFFKDKNREKRLVVFMSIVTVVSVIYMSLYSLIILMIVFTFIIMISSRWNLCKYVPKPSGWLLKPIHV